MTTREKEFMLKYLPSAVVVGDTFGINPSIILGQAAQEGAFGTSSSVQMRKNHFGITAYGSPNKYWDGSKSKSSVSGLYFRIYKTDADSFADFSRLITSKYADCAKYSNDIEKYARCISQSPYINEANGDNREGYRKSVEKFSKLYDPYVKEYKQSLLVKKRNVIIALTLSLLIAITLTSIFMFKTKKK